MKKMAFYLLLIVFPLVTFSCKDDEDPSASQDDLPGALVANINGQSLDFRYQPRAYEGTYEINATIYDAIFINGTTNASFTKELSISIVNPVVGSYELGTEALSNIFYNNVLQGGLTQSFFSNEGTITVTELGDRIKGTFNATLYNFNDDVEIPINGSFDLGISE
jgi:PBP1b-binding outer membrane lipoprotein LpoB